MRNEDSRRSRPSSFILHPSSFFSGFTFVELVVALSIGAMVVAVAVIAYGTIGSAGISKREVYVDLSSSYLYLTALPIAVSEAPSFAATAQANILRERFLQDVSSATAVVCLARNLPNSIRPTNFIIPTNIDARTLVTPEDFRTKLIDKFSNAYTSFSTNAINGASLATNLSIYVLYSGANATNITVDAIYEADWVTVTNAPVGVYATVRRFSWGTNMTACTNMTDFYHVFYPDATNNAFRRPVAAFFSRTNTAMTNSYSKASNQPFYFVWWPDPSRRHLNSDYPLETNSTDPRSDFMNHSGGTSYFFAVPAFPAL